MSSIPSAAREPACENGMRLDSTLIPEPVSRLREILGPEKVYVVGGLLRDSLASGPVPAGGVLRRAVGSDWDLATALRPREVMSRLRKAGVTAIPVGIEHGTVAAVIDAVQYEITTFRYDVEYADGRHPVVRFADSLEEDLQRRDFTINAFAMDLDGGEIIDLYGGLGDLRERRIRTVGEAESRFGEDYLRMLRAARFACKLEGGIDAEAFAAIRKLAHRIGLISAERIRDEIVKMLAYDRPSHGFVLMHLTGLLLYVLPELEHGFGVGQNRFHADDVAMHTLHSVDAVSPEFPKVRFTTLMHDLGKTPCKMYRKEKGDYVFYGHQFASKRMAARIMKRLRFSNKEIEETLSIVENHMYNLQPGMSNGAVRRFVRKLGREYVPNFLRMRMADRRGNHLNDDGYEKGLFHFVRTLRRIERDDDALKVTDLHFSGDDLKHMGVRPGPVYAVILNLLLESVLDDPALNRRGWLLEKAGEYVREYRETGAIQAARIERKEDGAEVEPSA
ncbi:MAG: HD domain-containing protein [bacterium]|nr:HD domain-containing protein [bacterium]